LSSAQTEEELRQILASEPLLKVDYADFIDESDFTRAHSGSKQVRAIVAGWINEVRLIDNMAMEVRA
jgi:pantoate--beta-alanine ligase